MIKSLQKFTFVFFLAIAVAAPLSVGAQTYDFESESGLDRSADAAGYSEVLKALEPNTLAGKIIAQVLGWLGVVFLGLIIYGGITWMTAEGNEQKVDKAKSIIVAAISGLVVVMLAYAVSYFILRYFTGSALV